MNEHHPDDTAVAVPIVTELVELMPIEATAFDGEEWDDDDVPVTLAGKRIMTPVTWVLIMLLCLGGGFALGVRTEKQHATSVAQSVISAGLAQARTRAGAAGAGGFGRTGTALDGATPASTTGPAAAGTIQLIDGRKVYVQDAQGNVAIVVAPASLDISKLAVGQNVTVVGTTGTDGTIAATSITATSGTAMSGTATPGTATPGTVPAATTVPGVRPGP